MSISLVHHAPHVQHGVMRPLTAVGFGLALLLTLTAIWLAFAFAMFSATDPVWMQLMQMGPR